MKVIDLTQVISPEMPVYPGTEPPIFNKECTIEGNGFAEIEMTLFTHTGTHLDCPAHIFKNGSSLTALSIEHFCGSGIVIDCTDIRGGERIGIDKILSLGSKLNEVEFIIFYTGWSKKWGTEYYFKDFPTLSEELVQKLTSLKIKGIGIDAISIEPISSEKLDIHHQILSKNIIIIENLTNLDKLINKKFKFCCFPLKIKDGDGSPIRAVAMEVYS